MIFALDTNTVIHFFRGAGRVAEHLLEVPPSRVAIPAVVLYELEVGLAKSPTGERRREQLAELAEGSNLLPFGVDEARAAAMVRLALERTGQSIGPLDTLIAGTALAHGATLVTRNLREFTRVEGLAVESWY